MCRGCDRIQPLDTQGLTYYELFGYGIGGDEEDGGGGNGGGSGTAGDGGNGNGGERGSSSSSSRPREGPGASPNPSGGGKRRWPPYALDPRDLERRYRELQWALHPDRLAGRPNTHEREVSHGAAAAALVNQAYGVLRSPLARANYLVEFLSFLLLRECATSCLRGFKTEYFLDYFRSIFSAFFLRSSGAPSGC